MQQDKCTTIATLGRGGLLLAATMLLATGCNTPPAPPRAGGYWPRNIQTVPVNPADAAEVAAVKRFQSATARYRQSLVVLHAYYVKVGSIDKDRWSNREMANLDAAQPWKFVGVEPPAFLPGQSIENVTEAALVEQVIADRVAWKATVTQLVEYYAAGGMGFKQSAAANILARYDPIKEYDYFLHAEIPPKSLRPTEVLGAANAMFEDALRLHRSGKPLPIITSYPKQRRALLMFRELIFKYPTSTRVADSAFYTGEIYKEYFNENVRAVSWYQRAWQWDPNIQLPARSQAAFVYDIRLANYAEALKLYHEVIKYEQYAPDRIRYAYQRIEELNAKRK